MCLFKRKKCLLHDWKLVDYKVFVETYSSSCTERYTLICAECKKKKKVDELNYVRMKRLGLIK